MDPIFSSRSYVGLGLMTLLALAPGITLIEMLGAKILFGIGVFVYLIIGTVTLVCAAKTFNNSMPKAPQWLTTTVMILFAPYTYALSTGIKSLAGDHSVTGYWIALGLAILLIVVAFFLRRKARRDTTIQELQ